MNLFGLTPDHVESRIRLSGQSTPFPTLKESVYWGSFAFCLASLVVFATVAFGEGWMYRSFGIAGSYAIWTACFIVVCGGVLSRLIIGPGRLARFYFLFNVAFCFYALSWIAAYFSLGKGVGEWVGSLVGSVLMGLTLASAFGAKQFRMKAALVLFLTNSAGYFVGGLLHDAMGSRLGMMLWGISFGLGLGVGSGYVLFLVQTPIRDRLSRLVVRAPRPNSPEIS